MLYHASQQSGKKLVPHASTHGKKYVYAINNRLMAILFGALLDHYGYRWMVHSPEGSMFRKQGVCIVIAAGAGR